MSILQSENFARICSNLDTTNNFSQFIDQLEVAINVNDKIQIEMFEAIKNCLNNSDSVNQWFFTIPKNYTAPLIWITPVINTGEIKFVWTVGKFNNCTNKISNLLKNVSFEEPFHFEKLPPQTIFFDPYKSSQWQISPDLPIIENIHELDIFQVAYDGENILEDIDQKLVMNTSFMEFQNQKLIERVQRYCTQDLVNFCEINLFPNILYLSALHIELHNLGHFAGYYPYSTSKNVPVYESVEEYRACLVATVLGSKLLSADLSKALSVHIILTRLLIYGLEPFLVQEKTHQDIREITSALFFHLELKNLGLLSFDNQSMSLDTESLDFLVSIAKTLHKKELEAINAENPQTVLQSIAIPMYAKAYPERNFPSDLANFYQNVKVI